MGDEKDRRRWLSARSALTGLVLGAACFVGCGGKSGTGEGTGGTGAGSAGAGGGDEHTLAAWSDLGQAEVSLQGGAASSPGGQAHSGGLLHLASKGGIALDPGAPPLAQPAIGSPASDAMAMTKSALGADVSAPGSVRISGSLASGGSDAVRTISAGGDIFIDGTLRMADLSGTRQGLTLAAPNGTVFVTGSVDASGASGGQAGGPLTITAQKVVVTGKLITRGASGSTSGDAGSISITATDSVFSSGLLDASGGDAKGGNDVTGAHGGDLHVKAGGDVGLAGTVRVRGGAGVGTSHGDARGGDAGAIAVDGAGALTCDATIDARGGFATAAKTGGAVVGGAAGSLAVGEGVQPSAITVLVPIIVSGGDGAAVGGHGGNVLLESHGGDLRIAGDLEASGGSAARPGVGGCITGHPGPENATASTDVSGKMVANGGSAASGTSGDGAAGGMLSLMALAKSGNLTIEPGAQLQTDGGGSSGNGTAGGGGIQYLFTINGNASLHGNVLSRGGAAPDRGGTGGGGGLVYVFTGAGHDRMSGVLIVENDGTIDASGGAGTTGGSARNDGHAGSVATFPMRQDDEYAIENIAVLINSDGVHGSDHGYIDNRGQIIARGGGANGSGGDVVFHGKRQDGNETPLPGNVAQQGDGTGMAGDYAGE
jgi:hypothetical protein